MQTVLQLLDHIPSDNLPYPHSPFVAEMEAIRARHIVKMREAIPAHDLPPLGYPSTRSLVIAHDGVIQMAEELLARILQSLRPHNAGIYEKLAAQTAKRMREFAHDVLSTFVPFRAEDDDWDCFRQELDATLHNLVQKAITVAWIAHEASYSESAREKARSEALPGPTGIVGTAGGEPDITGHLDPTDVVNCGDAPDGRAADVGPPFPARASWLRDRLLERGWGNSDPSEYEGPDRKTVQKLLRGEAVRNDVLQKLADALSQRHAKVNVLDIPQN